MPPSAVSSLVPRHPGSHEDEVERARRHRLELRLNVTLDVAPRRLEVLVLEEEADLIRRPVLLEREEFCGGLRGGARGEQK